MLTPKKAPLSPAALNSLEAQLVAAEKEVAIALDTYDYEELIAVVSDALKTKPTNLGKTLTKSRKNLLWARSHAYSHKGLKELALKDAKTALKLDPEDPISYIRTAVLLIKAQHLSQANTCLEKASNLADKLEATVKFSLMRKIEKQRKRLTSSSSITFLNLPNEILVEIASHLDTKGRSAMSQSCSNLRRILISAPSLWTSLTIVMKGKRLAEAKALEWLNYIRMCSERANNALESVDFPANFPDALLERVCSILRASSRSLEHIHIPSGQLSRCYDLLYRYCPRLKSIVLHQIFGCKDITIQGLSVQDTCFSPPPDREAEVEPFALESLTVWGTLDLDWNQHLRTLRISKGHDPFMIGVGQDSSSQDQVYLQTLADSLEEWEYPLLLPRSQRPFRSIRLTLSKLVKLTRYRFDAAFIFTFPKLLELEISCAYASVNRSAEEYARILRTSPMLCRLTINIEPIERGTRDLQSAIRSLQALETLELEASEVPDFIIGVLLPGNKGDEAGRIEVNFPLPRLQRLILRGRNLDSANLAFALLVREQLRTGTNLTEARHIATEKLVSGSATQSVVTPFQRGSASKEAPKPPKKRSGPRLGNDIDICPLQSIALIGIDHIPTNVEQVLRSLVPELLFEFDAL
ncbi:uncharacterized protein MEPE_04210 [Melanopsichium pennsylvanicum]|uniref:F-box domain-containing protein n=2 Tax=Melanopsichium pennsylvanicum TaxID=63383 RepID=A0AAJ5C673_9BASI|nr:putative protein [Melanopsichium pennsylvanicum 4]SNX85501.1 uncharacterized protein MEPE_04210 [Melanopsichium pennsylvanicum]